jgi:hypothetical protein
MARLPPAGEGKAMNFAFMSSLAALRAASTPEEARRAIDAAEKLSLSDYERGLLAGALVEASARCRTCG